MKTTHSDIDNKMKALAKFLNIDSKQIGTVGLSENTFETNDGEEFLILSDEEADSRAKDAILETVWAFRPEFLAAHLKEGVNQEVIELIQSNVKCEDNNKAILSLIDDVDHFVDDAIRADGRGHFLSSYDGEEIELAHNFFAYRIN